MFNRRQFLVSSTLGLSALENPFHWNRLMGTELPEYFLNPTGFIRIDSSERLFHHSVSAQTVAYDQELRECWKDAGVTDLWIDVWSSGKSRVSREVCDEAMRQAEKYGFRLHPLIIPLGHPGTPDSGFPENWERRIHYRWDCGKGISIHPNVERDCVAITRQIADQFGPCDLFLDDDFRLAPSPLQVGGCFCPKCREEFLLQTGYSKDIFEELYEQLDQDDDTPLIRSWVDFIGGKLTALFRKMEAAAPEIDLGIMVMCMGSERAGIQLDQYRKNLFRVGEGMFINERFNPLRQKMTELFSVLMHRRFCEPGRAFSETTCLDLTAENFTSKLSFSTFADVRNTMFMCFVPVPFWSGLSTRMKKEARYHKRILGISPKGPFKHFWGMGGRYTAALSDGYMLFLATGVPFEVTDHLTDNGWTFLGNGDARTVERGEIASSGTRLIGRYPSKSQRWEHIEESMDSLFAFRRSILPELKEKKIPYIEEETPIVLGWYPEARAFFLWNPDPIAKSIHLNYGDQQIALEIAALDSAMVVQEGENLRIFD